MADLTQAVTDLQTAVQGVSDRIATSTAPLQQALADAQAALAVVTAEDQSDQAALDQANADLAAALSTAQSAADAIEVQTASLNALAAPPVEPAA